MKQDINCQMNYLINLHLILYFIILVARKYRVIIKLLCIRIYILKLCVKTQDKF